jgi:hypothetical protein
MKVKHPELLSALNTCKPALATSSNRAIELTHFWFDGDFISAYNGRLGIVCPFDSTDVKGGIPSTLLAWLEKTEANEADLTTRGKELIIKVGASHATFAMLEPSKQILQPSLDLIAGEGVALDQTLITGLKNILVSLDPKSATPARMGAFFIPAYGYLDIYATDDNSISWFKVNLPDNYRLETHIVVPTGFIEQLLKVLPEGGKDSLFVHDHAVVCVNNQGVMVIGNLVDCPIVPDFTILSPYAKDHESQTTIPDVLSGALDRVMLVPNKSTEFAIENGILYIISESKGTTRFEEAMTVTNHPNVIEFFDPALLFRALDGRTSMVIEKGKLCLKGPTGFVHLIAASERNSA